MNLQICHTIYLYFKSYTIRYDNFSHCISVFGIVLSTGTYPNCDFCVFFSVSRRRMMLESSSCCWRRTLSRKTSSRDACWATPTAPTNPHSFIHSFIHCVFLCVSRRRMMLVSSSCCWRRILSRKTSSRDACWATPTAPTNPHSFIHCVFLCVSRRRMMLESSSCCWRRTLSRKTSSRDACWATPTAPTNPDQDRS